MAKKKDKTEQLSIEEQLSGRTAPERSEDGRGTLVRKPSRRAEKKLKARGENMVENTDELSGKYEYIIKSKDVEKEHKKRKIVRWLILFLLLLLLIGGGAWGVTSFLEYNNFRVVIDRPGRQIFAISRDGLFQDQNWKNTTEVYNISGPKYMDNITIFGNEQIFLDIETTDVPANRENLIAATFYLVNKTDEQRSYIEYINVKEATQGVEQAIRIMIVKTTYNPDGSVKNRLVDVYAAPHSHDENGNPIPELVVPLAEYNNEIRSDYYAGAKIRQTQATYEENGKTVTRELVDENATQMQAWYTTPFASQDIVIRNDITTVPEERRSDYIVPPMGEGGKVKISLFIWLEGNDKDCINDVLGGTMRLDLSFDEMPIPSDLNVPTP